MSTAIDQSPPQDGRWVPANELEEALQAAAAAGDRGQVMGLLATAPLYLPGVEDRPGAGQRLLTKDREGVPYLLVFTSVQTLHRVIRRDGWRLTTLAELVRAWPDLTGGRWGLAINPATPVGVLVAPDHVASLLPTGSDFEPVNDTERLLREALTTPDGTMLLGALVTSRVLVASRAVQVDGVWIVPVFTSPQRCTEFLTLLPNPIPVHEMSLVEVLSQWPNPEYRLVVNPGSSLAFSLSGDMVARLRAHIAVQGAPPSGSARPTRPPGSVQGSRPAGDAW